MSWASVSPTVLPLVGVAIGACGTLLGQHLAMRVDARREAAGRAADQRSERKDAIIGFLSATERVEQYREQLSVEFSGDARDLIEQMHAVWLAKKIVELVCSGTLAQAAQDYTRELNHASQELRPHSTSRRSPALSVREKQLRAEFVETARLELGYAGEPLLRRAHTEGDLARHEHFGGSTKLSPSQANDQSQLRNVMEIPGLQQRVTPNRIEFHYATEV